MPIIRISKSFTLWSMQADTSKCLVFWSGVMVCLEMLKGQTTGGNCGFGMGLYVFGVLAMNKRMKINAIIKMRTNFFLRPFDASIQPAQMKPVPNLRRSLELQSQKKRKAGTSQKLLCCKIYECKKTNKPVLNHFLSHLGNHTDDIIGQVSTLSNVIAESCLIINPDKKKACLCLRILINFYLEHSHQQHINMVCNYTAANHKALQWVVKTALWITGTHFPTSETLPTQSFSICCTFVCTFSLLCIYCAFACTPHAQM